MGQNATTVNFCEFVNSEQGTFMASATSAWMFLALLLLLVVGTQWTISFLCWHCFPLHPSVTGIPAPNVRLRFPAFISRMLADLTCQCIFQSPRESFIFASEGLHSSSWVTGNHCNASVPVSKLHSFAKRQKVVGNFEPLKKVRYYLHMWVPIRYWKGGYFLCISLSS